MLDSIVSILAWFLFLFLLQKVVLVCFGLLDELSCIGSLFLLVRTLWRFFSLVCLMFLVRLFLEGFGAGFGKHIFFTGVAVFSFGGGLGFEVIGLGEEVIGKPDASFFLIFLDPGGNGFHLNIFETDDIEEVGDRLFGYIKIIWFMNKTFGAILLFGMTSIDKEFFSVIDDKGLFMVGSSVLFIGAIKTGNLDLVFSEEPDKGKLDFGQAKG